VWKGIGTGESGRETTTSLTIQSILSTLIGSLLRLISILKGYLQTRCCVA
jgi:hypothetical protein